MTELKPTIVTDSEDPKRVLRADKWHTMELGDLYAQRNILTEKVTTALNMLEGGYTDTMIMIYKQIEQAEKQLNAIIDEKEKRGEAKNDKRIHSQGRKTT